MRSIVRWTRACYAAVVSPRLFLIVTSALFVVVAATTFAYPTEFLTLSPEWAVLAGFTAGGCAHAAIRPSRLVVTVAGALVICTSLGRAVANLVEAIESTSNDEVWSRAVAASVWSLIALLAHVAWLHFVTPWSAARRVS